jgi:hypothetical protein
MKSQESQGATFEAVAPDVYRLTVSAHAQEKEPQVYQHGNATVTLARDKLD